VTHRGKRLLGPALILALLFTGPPASTAVVVKREASAIQVLSQISVKGRAPKTGYSRAQFGTAWADVDHNGCDTRNDILTRDLVSKVYRSGGCIVASGILHDPYSGTDISFTRGVGTSLAVQIDHVVALSDAWQKGAFKLTLTQRTAFANDPLNLLAVMGRLNSQKSDSDAASWLPPLKSYRCRYVARQVAVKAKYGIWMTSAEKTAIAGILSKCPGELIPKG
jgi:Protein of unknown function (DUF1524)